MSERVQGYLPNDNPPPALLLGLAFQHLLTMFPATVLVAVLTHFDVGVTLFSSGLATILALFVSSRVTGSYIPLYYGSSFSYIAPIVAITAQHTADDASMGIRIAQGGIIMTGVLNVGIGILVRFIGPRNMSRLLPPEITGSVAIVIGVALAAVALEMSSKHWGVALVTMLASVMFSVYLRGRGMLGMLPILLAAALGYTVAWACGLTDFKTVAEAPWWRWPHFTTPVFTLSAVLAIAPIAIATIPESAAHLYQIGLYVDQLAAQLKRPRPEIGRWLGVNLVCDGLGDLVNGLLGGCAGTNYGENNSLMAITRNYSGRVLVVTGLMAMLLAFVGKLAAVIGTLPVAVTGGLAVYLFGVVGAQGIALQIAHRVNFFDPRKLAIVSIVLVIGIGGSMGYPGGMIPVFDWKLPAIATAALAGILLNAFFLLVPARQIDAEFGNGSPE